MASVSTMRVSTWPARGATCASWKRVESRLVSARLTELQHVSVSWVTHGSWRLGGKL